MGRRNNDSDLFCFTLQIEGIKLIYNKWQPQVQVIFPVKTDSNINNSLQH
jgi:hypothetical protein